MTCRRLAPIAIIAVVGTGLSCSTTADGDCTYYETCTAGVEVGLCVKQGGGHAPGDANVGRSFLNRFSLP